MKSLFSCRRATLLFLPFFFGATIVPQPLFAQSTLNELERQTIEFAVPDLTGRGRPGDRRGGGSRSPISSCSTAHPDELVTIVPTMEQQITVEYTLEAQPTFWFYLPYQEGDYHSVDFILRNDEETIQEVRLAGVQSPEIVSYTLPETVPDLELNRDYSWLVVVNCQDPEVDASSIVYAQGWIQRIAATPELERDLATATTDRDRAVILARHGIWYDALTLVGNLRRENDAIADWQTLLKAADLEDLTAARIAREPTVED
jgi:hypothetical protein